MLKDGLNTKTVEMRLFERCLLSKLQEKTFANSATGIDFLLRETYDAISSLINKFKDLKLRIRR